MRLLQDVESGRVNNLNLIPFLLASSVIWSHSYVFTVGITKEAVYLAWNFVVIGGLTVFSFFFISEYLIPKSAMRNRDIAFFIKARALRIFPALIAVVCLSTFVLGPIMTTIPEAIRYRYPRRRMLSRFPWQLCHGTS